MSFGHRVPVGVDKLSQQQPAVRACPASVSSARAGAGAHGRDEAATSLVRRLLMLSSFGATLRSMGNQDVQLEASVRANSAGCTVTLTSGINER